MTADDATRPSAFDAALDTVLAALEEGETVDAAWLNERHPDHAARLERVLDLQRSLLEGDGAPRELGPYTILAHLGEGGMGSVYAARTTDDPDAPERALKVIHPHIAAEDTFFRRFLREAQVGTRIEHPNVVRTLDATVLEGPGGPLHVLVMERVHGQTLRALLRELRVVPENLCRHIGLEVARGLTALHGAGVVHRDLKPENVLITADEVVKVMDLGVARPLGDDGRVSRTGAFVGSWTYAAPEQFQGDDVGFAADLYSLGLTLHELATGSHPFDDPSFHVAMRRRLLERPPPARSVRAEITPFFAAVLARLLARDPAARFDSADELAEVLREGEASAWWQGRRADLATDPGSPRLRLRVPRETSLHGRDEELARLRGHFERSLAGEGAFVLIEGEPGVGKSRLADALLEELEGLADPPQILIGTTAPGASRTAGGPVVEALREHFGRERLEPALRRLLGETPRLAARLRDELLDRETGEESAESVREALQVAVSGVLRSLAAERPVVLLVEDLNFLPAERLDTVSALAHAASGSRLLFLATARPDLPRSWVAELRRQPFSDVLELERLGERPLAALLEEALASRRLAADLARRIAAKSDGNPFFAFEIIRGLREGQFGGGDGASRLATTAAFERIEVPESIRALVAARVEALDDDERDLLEAASCSGYRFDGVLIGEALGIARLAALRRLARIEARHRLVRSEGELFRFDHHQLQEALYEGLPPPLAREYHALIGEALLLRREASDLEDRSRLALDADAAEIALHLVRGGRLREALPHLAPACDHLERDYQGRLVLELTSPLLAEPGLLAGAERFEVLLRRAHHAEILGRTQLARDDFDAARRLAEESGDDERLARVLARHGEFLRGIAEYEAARDVLERAVVHARRAGDRGLENTATGTLGGVLWNLGLYDLSETHLLRNRDLAEELGDLRAQATAWGHLGNLYFVQFGDVDRARDCFERKLALTRQVGDRRGEAGAIGNLAVLDYLGGRLAGALDRHTRNLAMSRQIGYREGEAVAMVNLGPTYMVCGQIELGIEILTAVRELCREIGSRRVDVYALGGLAGAHLERGELREAEELLRAGLALREEMGFPVGEGSARAYLAAALLDMGRTDDARAEFERACTVAGQQQDPEEIVRAWVLRSRVPGEDPGPALAVYAQHEEALPKLARMEAAYWLSRTAGREDLLVLARTLLEELIREAPAEFRSSMRTHVQLHRQILAD